MTAQPIESAKMPTAATPCPKCGYDLRGHATDFVRCPECGNAVQIGALSFEVARWFDLRLLDFWSIAVLQGIGCAATVLSVVAVHQGQPAALLLGLLAMLCVSVATVWFIALAPALLLRLRKPFMRAVAGRRLRPLIRWCITDMLLVAVEPVLFIILARW